MTLGRETYTSRCFYHPGKTCRQYITEKYKRATINSLKITFFASLLPQIFKKRKQLCSGDPRIILKTIRRILWRYFRAALFLIIGSAAPFQICCYVPLGTDPFHWMPQGLRISMVYSFLPIMTLIQELPSKMPSYMGFFVSKAISLGWGMLKFYNIVTPSMPFE